MDDRQLLREYVTAGLHEAFAQLVQCRRRHRRQPPRPPSLSRKEC